MLVTTLPIAHKTKHNEAVFTIHKAGQLVATGGMNGEVKLWDPAGAAVTTIQRHTGSVASVRFSNDGSLLASAGDDGRVYVTDTKGALVHTVVHGADVTNIAWTSTLLLSVDLDGALVATRRGGWTEAARVVHHGGSVTGLAVSPDEHWVATYSEGTLVLYRDLARVATHEVERGVIMESLNSRLSFAPNSRFLSIGLQFNAKRPTVDIFDTGLERVFSLVGHVAPSEITAFCPYGFRSASDSSDVYYILAVASQDLSLSLWSTVNTRPFLLLRNLTEAPILDLCWDGIVLYASSYDGAVKKIEFKAGELGIPAAPGEEDPSFELPLTPRNVALSREAACDTGTKDGDRPDKTDVKEFVINGRKLEEIHSTDEAAGGCRESLNKEPVNRDLVNRDPVNRDLVNRDPVNRVVPKRISPIMIQRDEKIPVASKSSQGGIVLFDTNLPEKLRITRTVPFSHSVGDFKVELNKNATKISVLREGRPFYTVSGIINKVCFSEKYLAVYSEHIQVYDIASGCLVLPYLLFRTVFMDILGDRLLLVGPSGDVLVTGLVSLRSWETRLPKTRGLTGVSLDPKRCVVARYGDEAVFYARRLRAWVATSPSFNSVYATGTDFFNDTDETIAALECELRSAMLVDDQRSIRDVATRLVGAVLRVHRLDDATEHKLRDALAALKDGGAVRSLLVMLNAEPVFHHFVEKECERRGIF